MLRFLAQTTLSVLANAVGLIIASILLDGFSIDGTAFIIAVLVFTVSSALLGPFIAKQAMRNMPYLMGGIALVTTLVSLVVTDFVSRGISIDGLTTWALATFVVWLFTVLASILLPLFLFKKTLNKVKED